MKTKMDDEELKLILIAECEGDDEANAAMKTLREKYDSTYMWCEDCDYLVTTEANCCNNFKKINNGENEFENLGNK